MKKKEEYRFDSQEEVLNNTSIKDKFGSSFSQIIVIFVQNYEKINISDYNQIEYNK